MVFRAKFINDILPMPIERDISILGQDDWTTKIFLINEYNIQYINKTLSYYRS
jgi:hypothetical protein